MDETKLTNILLDKLEIWSDVNVRHTNIYDDIEVLAENIKKVGVLVPLVVTPKQNRDTYHIISGQRRFIAARKAGLKTLPCIILHNIDKIKGTILSFSENIHRKDMNEEDKSNAAAYLKKELKAVEAVAENLGVSKSTVYNYLGYQNVSPRIKKLVSERKITQTAALHITKKYSDDEEFAYSLASDYAKRKMDKSEYYAAIKDSIPGETIEEIQKRFDKHKSTIQYTIRLPKSSSKIIGDIASVTKSKPEFILVQLVEHSIWLWQKGKVKI